MSGSASPHPLPVAAPRDRGAAVLVFVRAPESGEVKTRLAAEVGAEAALRVYRRLAERTVREAARLAGEARLRVHFTPASAETAVRRWLGPDIDYLPQAEGDLGSRMATAFEQAFHAGHRPVVIIGSDLPALTAELLRHALGRLADHPVVLGPARDGGYYLLGLNAPRPGLFTGIPWSTPRVLERTLQRLRAANIEPALLETLGDVDVAADLPPDFLDA